MKPQPAPKPSDIPVLRWLAGDKSLAAFLREEEDDKDADKTDA